MNAVRRPDLRVEMTIVMLLSLGQSAVYALLSLVRKLTEPVALNQQVTAVNTSTTPDRVWLDVLYQIVGVVFPLMPVALCIYLLTVYARPEGGAFVAMGFDMKRPWFDLSRGTGLFAAIGVPGLLFYVAAVFLGINTQVNPGNENWWMVPFLLLRAAMNGILEEVIMLGYLFTRWTQTGGRAVVILVASALIRGGYHLYQGFGGFIGNLVMGLVFGLLYLRWKRVMPLVIAHTLLDVVAFLGAPLLPGLLGLLGR